MKKLTLFLLALLFIAASATAQTARVQIIHNAPNPTVDVYVNGLLTLDDFVFRTATSFLDVPAGVPLSIAVAPENSTSVADAIATFPLTLSSGVTYAVTASGIVGNPITPFTLIADPGARETAIDPTKVEFNVLHGAPDAPPVDVVVRTGGKIVGEIAYGSFTPYLAVDPGVYYLDVKLANTEVVVGTFLADLTPLAGSSLRVLASGLVAGAPSFGLYAVLADGTVVELPAANVARLQVIHNSPSPTVDVYANGAVLIDDFVYRTATPFQFVPAGVPINIGVALANSTSVNDTLVNFTVVLENGKTYIATASGIVGDATTPFTLNINDGARETANVAGNVDVAVLHGSTNAPNVDVDAVFIANNLIADLAYGEFTPYLELPAAKYDLAVRAAGDPNVVASFRADLSGLAGAAAYVFASGLLGDTPAFGLFAALPNGAVVELPLTPTAQVQVVHNSASPTVDVYAGNTLLLDNFEYRTATPFVTVPADIDINFGVALETSTSAGDAIYNQILNVEAGKAYTVFAEGLVGDPNTPFNLNAFEAQTTGTGPTTVDVSVHHGSTDAPNVDVSAVFENLTISNLGYGESTPYLALPATLYDFAIRAAGQSAVVAMFRADLTTLGGAAARVFASGTLAGTPAFGLFAVLPNGTVIELPASPTARVQVIHNSPDPTVDVYAGNDRLVDNFEFRTATPFVTLPADRGFNIGIALADSDNAGDAIATFPFTLAEGTTYIVTASGIVGDPSTPFTLNVNDGARETANVAGNVDVAVLHGSTNAPNVDVDAVFIANNLIADLAYGEFTPYLELPAAKYDLAVRAAGDPNVVASFRADLSGLAGAAAYVFASGLLGDTPAFGLFAALPNGAVVELPLTPTAQVQVVHNSASPTVDVYAGNTLLLDNFAYRTATPFVTVPADIDINFGVALETSTSAGDAIYNQILNVEAGKSYTVFAEGLVGDPNTPFNLNAFEALTTGTGPTTVDVSVHHGSTDAPNVDVSAVFENLTISNLGYGESTPYLALPATLYDFAIRAAGQSAVVAMYRADLTTLGGAAARVFASGTLAGTPAFGLFAVLPDGTVIELPASPTARVQVIHNSPDPTVDVYAGNDRLIDNFEFRTATPFVTLPADRDFTIGIAPADSDNAGDAIATFPFTLVQGETYNVTASGIVADPTYPFGLLVNGNARETGIAPNLVDVAVLHGSPGAPNVDVDALFLADNLIQNLAFGENTPYFNLEPGKYDLAVRATGDPNIVAAYRADVSGLAGGAAYVFASGILGGTPGFGLFAALADGTVIEFPATPTARVQVIHNSPSPTVDVYAGNSLLIDNFVFRTATPFIDVPSDRDITIGIALDNSTSVNDTLVGFPVNLVTGGTYTVTATGIVGSGVTPFTLAVDGNARETAGAGFAALGMIQGAFGPGAFAIDVVERAEGIYFDNVDFGTYSSFIDVTSDTKYLDVKLSSLDDLIETYRIDLDTLDGQAVRLFTSGFLGTDPPLFGLFAALNDGTVIELPVGRVARVQVVHNSPEPTVDVYANGALFIDNFEFQTATPFVYIPAEVPINLGVALSNSTSVNDTLVNFTVTLENEKTYAVFASGIVGNVATPFTLNVFDQAREQNLDDTKIELAVHHGSPGAPSVDVQSYFDDGATLISDLTYGEFVDYLALDPDAYFLDIVPNANPNARVGIWGGDFSGLVGQGGIVYASGLLGGDPEFDLLLVLPTGDVVPLPSYALAQVIHNAPSPTVDVYFEDIQVLDNFNFREATNFGLLPARFPFTLSVAPGNSMSVNDAIFSKDLELEIGRTYIVTAGGVVGTNFDLFVNENGREKAASGAGVDLVLFHGSPDAPGVDVKLNGTQFIIFDDVFFSEYSDYFSAPAAQYIVDVTLANDNNTIIGSYIADVSSLEGEAITVFASGFITLAGDPGFEVWAALADGTTFPLPFYVSTNELDNKLSDLKLMPNPAVSELNLSFELGDNEALRYNVRDVAGKLMLEGDFGNVQTGFFQHKFDVGMLSPGMYQLELVSDNGVKVAKFVVQR